MPDLNSLPPSRPPSNAQPRVYGTNQEPLSSQPGSSPRASSVSLAAAATINAGMQNQDSRRSSTSSSRNRPSQPPSQRRSNVAMNLSLNDPALPGPGELQTSDQPSSIGQVFRTSSPRSPRGPYSPSFPQHHQRTPSLGELHQELEQESEAQVVCSCQLEILRLTFKANLVCAEPASGGNPTAANHSPKYAAKRHIHPFYEHGRR